MMVRLNWFSGGSERRSEAIIILEKLIQIIKNDPHLIALESVLIFYNSELKENSISLPYTLSRMNIEISRVLIEQNLHLSNEQSEQIQKLRELSNIRYGY